MIRRTRASWSVGSVVLASTLVCVSGTSASAQTTGANGGGQAFDNRQESIAMSFATRGFGIFGLGVPIRMFAYPRSVVFGFLGGGDWLPLEGQVLPIVEYDTIFAEMGTTYGGNGSTTFALPDARERVMISQGTASSGTTYTLGQVAGASSRTLTTGNLPPHSHVLPGGVSTSVVGSGQAFDNMQSSLAIQYWAARSGIFPTTSGGGGIVYGPGNPLLATIYMSCAVPAANRGTPASGALLPINQNQAVFALLGTQYGGNGTTNFALPDLRGRIPMTSAGGFTPSTFGQTVGLAAQSILIANMPSHSHGIPGGQTSNTGSGASFDNRQSGLGLQFAIATGGLFPSSGGIDDQEGYIGEIIIFAGNFPPNNTLRCEGQLLPISQNTALFSLIGTTYGGNGTTNFAIPDLRGRAIVGASANWPVGEVRGSNGVTLTTQQIPAHSHTFARCGLSDVAGANQAVGANGSLTADDIIVFLGWFFANDFRANVAGPNQSTTPDAQLSADDIIVFLGRFFAGC